MKPDSAYLNVISMPAVHHYRDDPIEAEVVELILQAGRASGSSRNTQPWTFFVARERETRDRIAPSVFAPENLQTCALAVAIASNKGGFDIGRCAQNMMLGAWALGVGSVPNGVRYPEQLAETISLREGETVSTILTFGYPLRRRLDLPAEERLARLNRRSMDQVVRYLD